MSPRKPAGQLPLPEPRSPQDLDDAVLRYAREHAPERQRFIPRAWMSGLAAAGIAGIALLIALPQTPSQAPSQQQDEFAVSEVASVSQAESTTSTVAATPPEQFESMASTRSAAPATLKQQKKTQVVSEGLSDSSTNTALSAPKASPASPPPATLVLEDAAKPQNTRELSAIQPLDDAILNEDVARKTPTERALYACRALLSQNNEPPTAAAQDCYADFRATCTTCELPETLQEALAAQALQPATGAEQE